MRATQVFLLLAFMVLLSNEVGTTASTESSGNGDCEPAVIKLGDDCIPKECSHNCIALGARSGNCIGGPACNCVFCGPRHAPPPQQ
ncbi:hypothetical protein BDA96_02G097900 [Sorghum bicolor]|uniref:Knottin scorpion toxin-like domain-containing protein n=2 Tax=Sorghum bicolor TaxID=4558 RepID=C5X2P1_SORBI|nr:hypothetical protein SORBI_3002G095000 [Sorghum bicolor]KAG0542371.1 hypothetical protein BDA96_02G097900 [Sorghum bicolor]